MKQAQAGKAGRFPYSHDAGMMAATSLVARDDAMPSRPAPIVTADSITRIGPEAKGAVVVNGSHGGVYAAYLAAKLGVAAAIFNDAGIGRDSAGIAGLDYLAQLGIPAAAVWRHDRAHRRRRRHDGARRHHPRKPSCHRPRLPRRHFLP